MSDGKRIFVVQLSEYYSGCAKVIATTEEEAVAAFSEELSYNSSFGDYLNKHMEYYDSDIEVVAEVDFDDAEPVDLVHCGSTTQPFVVDDRYLKWSFRSELTDGELPDETWESILEISKGNSALAMKIIDQCYLKHPRIILNDMFNYGLVIDTEDGYELCSQPSSPRG